MSDPFAHDPFASTPENTQEQFIPEPEESYVPQPSSGRISVTLKQSGAHGAPWIVTEDATVAGVETMVKDVVRSGLPQTVATAAEIFAKTAPSAPAQVPQSQPQAAPQQGYGQPQAPQNNTPPGVQAPMCQHGQKRLINGQYGPFWGCPAQREDPTRCKPVKYTG